MAVRDCFMPQSIFLNELTMSLTGIHFRAYEFGS